MNTDEIRMELDYKRKIDAMIKVLTANRHIVLATSYNDRVTAITVSYVSNGLDIYFLSWEQHKKCAQIKGNPKVALCQNNMQIKGVAEILEIS